jgi:hypothetical protein
MSIAIITACWRRPAVFRMFLHQCRALQPQPVAIVCAGSPGDQCAALAQEYGITYQSVPNEMGPKWNHAVAMASGLEQATHFLFMGSDDIMDQRMWEYYQAYTGAHLGLLDLCFADLLTKRVAYWPGYVGRRAGEPIGAAKLVRADVLDALGWEPFPPNRPNALDGDMHARVLQAGFTVDTVRMSDTGGLCMDIKDRHSLTPWATILQQPGVVLQNPRWLQRRFPSIHNLITYQ